MGNPQRWFDVGMSSDELRPQFVLQAGQSFSWKQCGIGEWVGPLNDRVVHIKQAEQSTLCRYITEESTVSPTTETSESCEACLHESSCAAQSKPQKRRRLSSRDETHRSIFSHPCECEGAVAAVRRLFHANVCIADLTKQWCASEKAIQRAAKRVKGYRVMQLEPVECVFSFICSANNNIPRISLLVERLRREYGDLIGTFAYPLPTFRTGALYSDWVNAEGPERQSWFKFPTIRQIADSGDAQRLRDLGFGYRAESVVETARQLDERGGVRWLESLRDVDRAQCERSLTQLRGIGSKVAECIGLFGLGHTDSVPVDTHLWKIAKREIDPSLQKVKSLTPAVTKAVGDMFRRRYGPFAGWAHSLLFTAEVMDS